MSSIVNPLQVKTDEDGDIQSVKFAKISVEQLQEDDVLLSVNSLMNFVEHHQLDADQLKDLLCELLAAASGGMLDDRSNQTAKEFFERYANVVHEIAPAHAVRNKFPKSDNFAEQRKADVTFFENVILRNTEHATDKNWQADAEKRWLQVAKDRLDELTRDLAQPAPVPGNDLKLFRSRRYANAVSE